MISYEQLKFFADNSISCNYFMWKGLHKLWKHVCNRLQLLQSIIFDRCTFNFPQSLTIKTMFYLVWSECLTDMCIFQKSSNWQNVWSSVHHNEVESSCEIQTRYIWIVLHDVMHQTGNLLYQNRVKGQQELKIDKMIYHNASAIFSVYIRHK